MRRFPALTAQVAVPTAKGRTGRRVVALGLAAGLILPLAACSNDEVAPEVSETSSAPAITEPITSDATVLEQIETLRPTVDGIRKEAKSLTGEAQSFTFDALAQTEGALGESTGVAKAAKNNEPNVDEQIVEAGKKITAAQEAIDNAKLKLKVLENKDAVSVSDGLDTLRVDLDTLWAGMQDL